VHKVEAGQAPALDLEAEGRLCRLLVSAASRRLLSSAHDMSEGGLAVTLAECAIAGRLGAALSIDCGSDSGLAPDRLLFSESGARAVVSLEQGRVDELLALAASMNVPAAVVGRVGGDRLCVEFEEVAGAGASAGARQRLDVSVDALRKAYEEAIPCAMQG